MTGTLTTFDEVFDAQQVFRVVLDALSRPGRTFSLTNIDLEVPASLGKCRALVARTLLDHNTSFHIADANQLAEEYIRRTTSSRVAAIEEAEFVFLNGTSPAYLAELPSSGDLLYPETAATLLLQVAEVSQDPLEECLELRITGPGVETIQSVYVSGLDRDLIRTIASRNVEYPLGLDTLLCCDFSVGRTCVVGLPRTAAIEIRSEDH